MKLYIFIVGLLFPIVLTAQIITGKVTNAKRETLAEANIRWIGTGVGTITAADGSFSIDVKEVNDKRLVVSYVGYLVDTIDVKDKTYLDIELRVIKDLTTVTVTSQADGIINSLRTPVKVEQITQHELKKAACCDLAGCFETQLTVQPQTTNIITNSKELRILGLSGVYNQVLVDGMPMIQGLSYIYGISSIPGTLVDNIYISKGANSVIQGYESISGQINVDTKKPDHTDKLLLNVYLNSFMEKHLNVNYAFKKGKWTNLTAFQTVQPSNRVDRDHDDFLDLPLLTRYMLYNRWKYGREKDWGWNTSIALRYLDERRIGGQWDYNPGSDKGSTAVYGQTVSIKQPEILTKTGYRFNDKHYVVLYISSFHQSQHSFFGTVKYDGAQTNLYTNLQHELSYGTHELKSGISFRYLNLDEKIAFTETALGRTYAGKYSRLENIPGFFAENTMRFFKDRLTWIAGARLDDHNQFGTQFTPRTLIKYDLFPKTVLRANIGTGWRTVNLFSENINLLASSRNVIFAETLRPEKAFNTGINLTQKFDTKDGNLSGSLSIDYYHTNFQNQVFPDYDTDPAKAIIRNFSGTSISNGFQAELFLKIWKRFELKAGYNWLDVYQETTGGKKILPFNPRDKFLSTFSYRPLTNKFHWDLNIHWFGKQRLPGTKSNPAAYQRPDFSEPYTTVNTQVTYNFKKLELYAGCENIFNVRQKQPILSWDNPFGPYFDTSSVWGPTRGTEAYIGIRFRIKQ